MSVRVIHLRLHIQKPVPHDAVHIAHGIDMSLHRTAPKRLIRLLEPDHRVGVVRRHEAVLPCDALAELRHTGRDHVSQFSGGFRQPQIGLPARLPRIQNVDGRDGRLFVRVRCQRFQRGRHDISVPGLIRPEVCQRLLVNADDQDIGRRNARPLEQGVLHPAVQTLQYARPCQSSDYRRRDQRIDKLFAFEHGLIL